VERKKIMVRSTVRIAAALSLTVVLLTIAVQPAGAVHETFECGNHPQFGPLLQLIHDVTDILFILGAALAVASLAYAGIVFTWGASEPKRRAIQRVKRALIGVVILFMAPLLVTFIVSYFPGCSGGA
jgi:hypothetical protein